MCTCSDGSRRRGSRGGKPRRAQPKYSSLDFFCKAYVELPTWMARRPRDAEHIEELAANMGWTDFTVREDVIEHGESTKPYAVFAVDKNKSAVVMFCTLDTGGSLSMGKNKDAIPYFKIGNLLSEGNAQASARHLIDYAQFVVRSDEDLSADDYCIIADIEETNHSSRRAFEVQGFKEVKPRRIKIMCDGTLQTYSPPTDDPCVLAMKMMRGTHSRVVPMVTRDAQHPAQVQQTLEATLPDHVKRAQALENAPVQAHVDTTRQTTLIESPSKFFDASAAAAATGGQDTDVYMVFEDYGQIAAKTLDAFARRSKEGKATPLDETLENVGLQKVTAIPLVKVGPQYYDAKSLHRCPHYMLTKPQLDDLCQKTTVDILDPIVPADVSIVTSDWEQMKTLVQKEAKDSFRGNQVVTYGFSGMNAQSKWEDGGRPLLTASTMSDALKDLCLPYLDYLSQRVAAHGYAPRGDNRFAHALRPGNYFEAVAVGVTRAAELNVHVDRMNDCRVGYNIMGALTFTGTDEHGPYRVGIFGYTRKVVGDYLQWEAQQG